MRDWPGLCCLAASIGIWVCDSGEWLMLFLAAVVAIVWDSYSRGRQARFLWLVCLLFCLRAYASFEVPLQMAKPRDTSVWEARLQERVVELEMMVTGDPKVFENQIRVQAQACHLDLRHGMAGKFEAIFSKPFPTAQHQDSDDEAPVEIAFPELEQGQRWLVEGSVETVPGARFPGDIDTQNQLARKGITQRLRIRQWRKLGEPGGLLYLRHLLRSQLRKHLAPREAGLVIGVALGDASLLDPSLNQAFHRTSTTHLLAASGANVALLVWIVCFLGERLGFGPRPTALPCLGFGFLYTGLAGYASSIVRAVWMSLFSLWARHFGLQCGAGRSLAFAFLACLALSPATLFDCGFQLSAGAVASLVWLQPPFEKMVPKILAPGVAVFWGLLPISLFSFQEINPGGVLANLLIAPFVEVLLPAGLWLSITQVGGSLIGSYSYWCIEGVLWLSQFFSSTTVATPVGVFLGIWLAMTLCLVYPRYAGLMLIWVPALGLFCQPPQLGTIRTCRIFQMYGRTVLWWQGSPNLVIAEDPKTSQFAAAAVLRNHQPGEVFTVGWTQVKPFQLHTLERLDVQPNGINLEYGRFRLGWGQTNGPKSLVVRKNSVCLPDCQLVWDLREHPLEISTDGHHLSVREWQMPEKKSLSGQLVHVLCNQPRLREPIVSAYQGGIDGDI